METERPSRTRRPLERKERQSQQPIQYTQPKPFFKNRLIVQLISIAAVVLAVTIGVSIFFKVDTVMVAGAEKHTPLSISEASGIEQGDSLLFFGKARAAAKIKKALPYVDTVRFQLKLPGTVHIIVEEKMVAYALQAEDGAWWMMTADGMIAEQTDAVTVKTKPIIEGVVLASPKVGELATAAESSVEGMVIATGADRLNAAVAVLAQLEIYQMFSQTTALDVSDLFAIRLYCGEDCRIELGDATDMAEKIEIVKYALLDLDGSGGVLKLTYNDVQKVWEIIRQPWSRQ